MTSPALFVAVAMLALFVAAHARVSAQLVRPPPLITHAVADHALRSLHITGTDFGTLLPTVNLADVSLGVTTFNPQVGSSDVVVIAICIAKPSP